HRRARAASLQEVACRGGGPLKLDCLASHERAVRVRELDAAGQLAPARAAPVTGGDERATPADVRHSAGALELPRGEDSVGALRQHVVEPTVGLGPIPQGTMSPLGVTRTVLRPHPDPFLNGWPSIALRIGSVVLASRAAASSRRNPSQNSS